MKIKEILVEYNLQNILYLFQEKYKEIKNKDPSNTHENLKDFIKSIENPLKQQNKFQFIEPYMKWIVQRYITGKLNKYEDVVSKVIPSLLKYDSLKRKNKLKPEHKDINQVKDINQLLNILDQYKEEETLSGKEKEKEIEENFYKTGEAILLHNDPDFKVVIPKSERASCFFGRNTRWCTAATQGKNYFTEYDKRGDLYIVIVKKENKRFQFHFSTRQFNDEMDKEINFTEFYEKYPRIYEFFSKIARGKGSLYFRNPKEISQNEFLKNLKSGIFENYIDYIILILENNPEWMKDENFILNFINSIEDNIEYYLGYLAERCKIPEKFMKKIIIEKLPLFFYLFKSDLDFYMEKFPFLKSEDFYIEFIEKNPQSSRIVFFPEIKPLLGKKFYESIKDKPIEKIFFDTIMHKDSISQIKNFNLKEGKYFISFILNYLQKSSKDDNFYKSKNIIGILELLKKIKEEDKELLNTKILSSLIMNLVLKTIEFQSYNLANYQYIEIFNEEIKKGLEENSDNILGYVFGTANPKSFAELYKEKLSGALYLLEYGLKNNLISEEYVIKCFFSVLDDRYNRTYFINSFIPQRKNEIPNLHKVFLSNKFMNLLDKKIEKGEIYLDKEAKLTLSRIRNLS